MYAQIHVPLVIEKEYNLKNIPSPQDMAWDGNNFWVIDNFTFSMYKLSSDYESVDTSFYFNPIDFRDLTFDGKYFWLVDNTFHQVLKINRDSLYDIKVLSLPVENFITGIACDNKEIYLAWYAGWSSQIAKIVPGKDSISFVAFTEGIVTGLTYYNEYLYYCFHGQGIGDTGIIALKSQLQSEMIIYSLPNEIEFPSDVEIVSGYFWVLDFGSKKLYKLGEDSTSSSIVKPAIPKEAVLFQNYPNPFNPSTTISYQIPQEGIVSIKLYDALGKEVATLINKYQQAGYYTFNFNASKFTSGVYIYKMNVNKFTISKKMLLMK